MSTFNTPSLRKFAGIFLLFSLVGVFLSLYFLKYIPQEEINFHHSSFLELKQFQSALEERNDAYAKSIENFIQYRDTSRLHSRDTVDLTAIAKRFNYHDYQNKSTPVFYVGKDSSLKLHKIGLKRDKLTNNWQIEYTVCDKDGEPVAGFRKNIDTLVGNLVTSYRDIFDDYLIIRDNHLRKKDAEEKANSSEFPDSTDHLHDGEIIFNSGNLSVDYLVNTDSLLKKNDGFSLLNIHDVIIEGNSYKLFLYPIRLGKERLILAGLISLSRYNAQFKRIPFNSIAVAAVLVLLILINLPLLKIFMIGPFERIQDLDIRLLIGTYFISVFIGFFLFSNSFLMQTEKKKNNAALESFASKVTSNFTSEIDSMCTELKALDSSFYTQTQIDSGKSLKRMIFYNSNGNSEKRIFPDTLLRPSSYPYLNNIFWIDSSAQWLTSWGFKKNFRKEPLLKVSDRQYFKDFRYNRFLQLPGNPRFRDEFTIQPNLSKLDGEYTITVIIKSGKNRQRPDSLINRSNGLKPAFVGLSSDMNFVTSSIPAPGFNFCIINDNGDVLYDSKPGRALLSNILKVVDRPADLFQCARYQSEKYFDQINLRGRQVSMLSVPMKNFPYTLLVYYKIADTEDIHVHLIAVSATIMAAILLILLMSALINEWAIRKQVLLQFPRWHFEWLNPDARKKKYYRHLSRWMSVLFAFFALWWTVIEMLSSLSGEFSLFYFSILFPFYAAIHYFLIREKNYSSEHVLLPRKIKFVLIFLTASIVVINCYGINSGYSWQLLIPEGCLSLIIYASVTRFSTSSYDQKKGKSIGAARVNTDIVKPFALAVLIGVFLISIVPALGIFCLLLKQETGLQAGFSQIEMTRQINSRRLQVNQRIRDEGSFVLGDSLSGRAVNDLKFKFGIYTLGKNQVLINPGIATDSPSVRTETVSPGYLHLHNIFFPESGISDSTGEALTDHADSSWYFFADGRLNKNDSLFIDQNEQDGENRGLVGQRESGDKFRTATGLLFHQLSFGGELYMALATGGFLICICALYFGTRSLAKRIFLLDFVDWKSKPGITLFDDQELLGSVSGLREFIASPPPATIGEYEENCLSAGKEERILKIGEMLKNNYQNIWAGLSAREKFLLYDFALDGFTNYRNGYLVHGLVEQGILLFRFGRLRFMTLSFREYVLGCRKDDDIVKMEDSAKKQDSWRNIKIPLLLILAMLGLFIFFTQDLIYQKITGLFTLVGTIVPLLGILFPKYSSDQEDGKK